MNLLNDLPHSGRAVVRLPHSESIASPSAPHRPQRRQILDRPSANRRAADRPKACDRIRVRFAMLIGFVVSGMSVASYAANDSTTLSLSQLIQLAERDNKDLQAARYAIQIGQARLLQAGLWPNPRLELSGGSDAAFRNEGEYTRSAGISQQFPVAGRILRQKNVARVDIALAEAEIADAERRLVGEVATAAYRILVIDRQIQSRDDLVAVEEKLAKTTRDRYKAAEVSELDVNTVQLDLQRLLQEKALLQNQHQALLVSLNTLIGRPAAAALAIDEQLPDGATLPSLQQIQTQALESRPDLRNARLGVDRAQAQRALAKAQRWEDWSVGLGVQQDKVVPIGAPPQSSDRALMLSVSIPLPLFNKNQGLIAEAEASGDQAIARIEALRVGIAAEVASAYAESSNLHRSLDRYRQDLLPVSARNVQLAQKGYGQGLVSVVEVVQAQRQQAELNATYLTTLDQYLQALVRLRTATGGYATSISGARADAKEH